MAPARRRGAPAAPGFVDARFRADPWITEGTLRSRGRAIGMLAPELVPRLDSPSLKYLSRG